jgi:hypothetical protein
LHGSDPGSALIAPMTARSDEFPGRPQPNPVIGPYCPAWPWPRGRPAPASCWRPQHVPGTRDRSQAVRLARRSHGDVSVTVRPVHRAKVSRAADVILLPLLPMSGRSWAPLSYSIPDCSQGVAAVVSPALTSLNS